MLVAVFLLLRLEQQLFLEQLGRQKPQGRVRGRRSPHQEPSPRPPRDRRCWDNRRGRRRRVQARQPLLGDLDELFQGDGSLVVGPAVESSAQILEALLVRVLVVPDPSTDLVHQFRGLDLSGVLRVAGVEQRGQHGLGFGPAGGRGVGHAGHDPCKLNHVSNFFVLVFVPASNDFLFQRELLI